MIGHVDEYIRLQQESLRQALQAIDSSQLHRLSETLKQQNQMTMESAAEHMIKEEVEQRERLLSQIADSYPNAATMAAAFGASTAAEQFRGLAEGPLEEARSLQLIHSLSNMPDFAAREITLRYQEMFGLPGRDEIAQLAVTAVNASALASTVGSSFGELEAGMRSMQNAWANSEDWNRSALGFVDLQAIGQLVRLQNQFGDTIAAALRQSLGDWRDELAVGPEIFVNPTTRTDFYLQRGFDPGLTDFPIAAFDESMAIAGLFDGDAELTGDPLEEREHAQARQAFDRLQRLEKKLRRFIEYQMQTVYGDHWMKRQLPGGMLDAWSTKRDAARNAGRPAAPLIDYADFTDYVQIIGRSDNWRMVFAPFFGRVEDVRESFQRLFPLRVATMHCRVITNDDRLLLFVETKRIYRAIH